MQVFICPCPHKMLLKGQNGLLNKFNKQWKQMAYLIFECQPCNCKFILRRRVNHISPSPHYFLNKPTMLVIIRFLRIFSNTFCFRRLGIDSTIRDSPRFDILLNMKIAKYMVRFRENFINGFHQSGVPIGDNHLRHVAF